MIAPAGIASYLWSFNRLSPSYPTAWAAWFQLGTVGHFSVYFRQVKRIDQKRALVFPLVHIWNEQISDQIRRFEQSFIHKNQTSAQFCGPHFC